MTLTETFNTILKKNGPDKSDYSFINEICQNHPETLKSIDKTKLDFLQNTESIMGHMLQKPHGYAGDYEIIDRIYTHKESEKYKKWDKYSLSNSAAVAVRNRKDYFKSIIQSKIKGQEKLTVLNIASGPARDVFEIFEETSSTDSQIEFTCLDMDSNAIDYAKEINIRHLDKVNFINKNIFRFNTETKYDLVWSAGLFDYFNDKAFVATLKKMKEWINQSGEIIIGNFNAEHNPSRNYMEIIGDWHLQHRSETELTELAIKAGFSEKTITVGCEEENVNLFLHLQNERKL